MLDQSYEDQIFQKWIGSLREVSRGLMPHSHSTERRWHKVTRIGKDQHAGQQVIAAKRWILFISHQNMHTDTSAKIRIKKKNILMLFNVPHCTLGAKKRNKVV